MRQRQPLPTLWMMTDERVEEERLIRAARRLPRGTGIVLRHYGLADMERHDLFLRLRRIAVRRGLVLFLGGDPGLAVIWGADGSHGEGKGRSRLPRSMAVHDRQDLYAAERARADLIFVSPLFATRSHPGGRALGVFAFAALARATRIPVMALGGVGFRHGLMLPKLGAAGFGAIDAWTRYRCLDAIKESEDGLATHDKC